MGEHRSRIGAALLGCVAVFAAAGASTVATKTAEWGNPIVIGLLAAAALCLALALWAFVGVGGDVLWRTDLSLGAPSPPTEVNQERERQDAGRAPAELWDLFAGLTDMQAAAVIEPFVGTWIELSGAVDSVMDFDSFVQVTLDRGEDGPHRHHTSYLMFTSEDWRTPLARLAEGDAITVRGEIERVTRVDMQLTNCAIVGYGDCAR